MWAIPLEVAQRMHRISVRIPKDTSSVSDHTMPADLASSAEGAP